MKKSKAEIIIEELKQCIYSARRKTDRYESSWYFTYTGNIKSEDDISKLESAPRLGVNGTDEVKQYLSLFKDLYDVLCVSKKKMSLKEFQSRTEQMFFTNTFDLENIQKFINNLSPKKYYTIQKIYGCILLDDFVKCGNYIFVNKLKAIDYIEKNIENIDIKKQPLFIGDFEWEQKSEDNFMYLIHVSDAVDQYYAIQTIDEKIPLLINILRWIVGCRDKRFYIDSKKFIDNSTINFQMSDDGHLSNNFSINRKDAIMKFSGELLLNKENGFNKVFEILNKNNANSLEKRILTAINWLGMSTNEDSDNIALVEMAFAFEALLKVSSGSSPVSSSIQGQISEMVAFITAKDLESRKNTAKDFTTFYSLRSSVVHGDDKAISFDYLKYFTLAKETIVLLLTDDKLKNCTKIENVKNVVDNIKFS